MEPVARQTVFKLSGSLCLTIPRELIRKKHITRGNPILIFDNNNENEILIQILRGEDKRPKK